MARIHWWRDNTIPRDQGGKLILDGNLVKVLKGAEQGKQAQVITLGNWAIYARTQEPNHFSQWFRNDKVRHIKKEKQTAANTNQRQLNLRASKGGTLEPTMAPNGRPK